MMAERLASREFVDMVLGQEFCSLKVPEPEQCRMVDVEHACPDDVEALREQCLRNMQDGAEFTLFHDGLRFRVTTLHQEGGPVWFLSRIDAQARPIHELPLPADFVAFALRPALQGMILITGGFGTGKTTTASSLFSHRIERLGGTGVALEDPVGEVRMAGPCGPGRILQIPVSSHNGGYHAALQLVRRSRADFVMIGEIRDASTAVEAQDIANADMPVIATMHASSIAEAFDKYQSYLRSRDASSSEANSRLALSISGIAHLSKEYRRSHDGQVTARYISRNLVIDRANPESFSIMGKIRDGDFTGLNDEIDRQAARRSVGAWGG